MKPRQRVVTAEDVQSSLYYIHVDDPADEAFLSSVEQLSLAEEDEGEEDEAPQAVAHESRSAKNQPQVHRKPLPSRPQLQLADERNHPPDPYLNHRPASPNKGGHAQIARKALKAQHTRFASEDGGSSKGNDRLFPRPMNARFVSADEGTMRGEGGTLESQSRRWSEQPVETGRESAPPLPPRHGVSGEERPPPLPSRGRAPFEENVPPLPPRHGVDGGALGKSAPANTIQSGSHYRNEYQRTTIHEPFRNLFGEQNGLAKAEGDSGYTSSRPLRKQGFQITMIRRDPTSGNQWNVGRISSTPSLRTDSADSRAPVNVEISTPGYSRFCRRDSSPSKTSSPLRNSPNGSPRSSTRPSTPGLFVRQVRLGDPEELSELRPGSSGYNDHRASLDILNPNLQRMSFDANSSTSSLPRKMKSHMKEYTFLSPWSGICSFATGAGGRTIKCKHRIPSGSSGTSSASAPISELRFNLPAFGGSSTTNTNNNDRKRSSYLSGSRSSMIISQPNDREGDDGWTPDEEEALDLSLGQERAGGGFRGRQAKLGKLIIEDEGLKMLDLVVAANMGLWWGVYESKS